MVGDAPGEAAAPPASPRTPWRIGVPLILAVAGLLFTTTATTARGTDLRSGENLRLADLIRATEVRNERTGVATERLAADIEALTAAAGDPTTERVRLAAEEIRSSAGLVALTGPGLTVTLNDAPAGAIDQDYPGLPRPTPDDLVVHQQDLQAVVNALWAGGADAIKLMDQRIISTSAVRCVGNVLILQGRVYSPPYTVTAIGDPARLNAAMRAAPEISNYREYVDAYGLGWRVQRHANTTVPAYSGSVELRYAEVVEK